MCEYTHVIIRMLSNLNNGLTECNIERSASFDGYAGDIAVYVVTARTVQRVEVRVEFQVHFSWYLEIRPNRNKTIHTGL